MENDSWSRNELLLAINLYCKTTFGRLHKSNPDVIDLSRLIQRTPSAVAWKLVNFASLDPSIQERGLKGATNVSRLDKAVWAEFYGNWEELVVESEGLLSALKGEEISENTSTDILFGEGKEKKMLTKVRLNQSFFRTTVLASYEFSCCITGISNPELLIASHISTWSEDKINRMNPRNGLCLNALHDRAFESGLLSITSDYTIKISRELLDTTKNLNVDYFLKFENKKITLPKRFLPDPSLLDLHFKTRFIQ